MRELRFFDIAFMYICGKVYNEQTSITEESDRKTAPSLAAAIPQAMADEKDRAGDGDVRQPRF